MTSATVAQKCAKKKNKEVIEEKIFNDMMQRGLLCNLLKNFIEKYPMNDEVGAIASLFNMPLTNPIDARMYEDFLNKRGKPKKQRKKHVLTPEHIQAMKDARAAKKKLRDEEKRRKQEENTHNEANDISDEGISE